MSTNALQGRWTGNFYVAAGLATQAGTLDITVADDWTFSGKALDNNVPEDVTGKFIPYNEGPDYSFEIHIYGPWYHGSVESEPDGSLKLHGDGGMKATLTRVPPA